MKTQVPPLKTFDKLIHKQAYYCWQRLPNPKFLEYQDLFSEGKLVYYQAKQTFDNRVKFITYYHKALRWRMMAVLQKAYKHNRVDIVEQKLLDAPCRDTRHIRVSSQFCQNLSRLAWLFVRELLDPSDNFARFCRNQYNRETRSPLILKRRVFAYLRLTPKQKKMVVGELRIKLSKNIIGVV